MRRIDDITRDRYPARNDETRLRCSVLSWSTRHCGQRRPSRSAAAVPAHPITVSGSVSAAAEPEAAQLVAHYLRQARGAAFDAVLRVSAQFGVSVPLDAIREAAAAFVTYWADNPAAGYDPLAWPPDLPVHDMLGTNCRTGSCTGRPAPRSSPTSGGIGSRAGRRTGRHYVAAAPRTAFGGDGAQQPTAPGSASSRST